MSKVSWGTGLVLTKFSTFQDFKDKIKNFFAPTDYSEGLDNKAAAGLTKDAEAGHKVVKCLQSPTFDTFVQYFKVPSSPRTTSRK